MEAGGLERLVLTGAARRLSVRRAPLQLGLAGAGWWWEVAGALIVAALVGTWFAGAVAPDGADGVDPAAGGGRGVLSSSSQT
jgi:hypothetical protein